jgi:hypothetical protein
VSNLPQACEARGPRSCCGAHRGSGGGRCCSRGRRCAARSGGSAAPAGRVRARAHCAQANGKAPADEEGEDARRPGAGVLMSNKLDALVRPLPRRPPRPRRDSEPSPGGQADGRDQEGPQRQVPCVHTVLTHAVLADQGAAEAQDPVRTLCATGGCVTATLTAQVPHGERLHEHGPAPGRAGCFQGRADLRLPPLGSLGRRGPDAYGGQSRSVARRAGRRAGASCVTRAPLSVPHGAVPQPVAGAAGHQPAVPHRADAARGAARRAAPAARRRFRLLRACSTYTAWSWWARSRSASTRCAAASRLVARRCCCNLRTSVVAADQQGKDRHHQRSGGRGRGGVTTAPSAAPWTVLTLPVLFAAVQNIIREDRVQLQGSELSRLVGLEGAARRVVWAV